MGKFSVKVCWNDRKESAAECAARAAQILQLFAQVDMALGKWYQPGRSPQDALKRPVATDIVSLEKLCRRGVSRTDMPPRTIIVELGFRILIWNGGIKENSAGLSLRAGVYDSPPGIGIPNLCMLELPDGGPAGERLNRLEPVLTLMEGMAQATDALWGVAMSSRYLDRLIEKEQASGIRSPEPNTVCWVTYLAAHARAEEAAAVVAQELPQLPPPVRTTDGGVFLLTTRECFNVDNPAHWAAAEELERVLKAHGLLTFAPPARKKRSGGR